MIRNILVISLLNIYHFASAQVQFTYDAAGNRIKRDASGGIVQLDVKAYLKGACRTGQANMANDLQIYFTATSGLLPATDPYGGGATYASIGNPAAAAGALVDWVKVEIRSAADPKTVLQTRSLLLKTNGSIVDTDGTTPKFFAQANPIHITIKHRNHIAILSNPIANFSGAVPYDFTTSLAKAFQLPGDIAQMSNQNGKWALWAGDVNGDYAVDAVDAAMENKAFNTGIFDQYVNTDLNMDGYNDAVDATMMSNAFNTGYYSTLLNYEY